LGTVPLNSTSSLECLVVSLGLAPCPMAAEVALFLHLVLGASLALVLPVLVVEAASRPVGRTPSGLDPLPTLDKLVVDPAQGQSAQGLVEPVAVAVVAALVVAEQAQPAAVEVECQQVLTQLTPSTLASSVSRTEETTTPRVRHLVDSVAAPRGAAD
jgi:hypothetical protein